MKAAIYARYSTELQSADSIEDQTRVCERLAQRHGFEVVARFSDAAISGGTSQRPGYQDLLRAARAHDFDVILAEDSSRLWRQLKEQWDAVAELTDLKVHIVTQDIDTRAENFKILLSVHGAMADVYRDQIAYRTKRGLEGKALNRKPTGGRAFGYVAARDSGSGERAINSEQAETVVRIFQWYADGWSPRKIAAQLNAEGIPSPGSSWNRKSERLHAKRRHGWVASAIHGDRTRGTGILNNPVYSGEVVWGRSTWKRSAADSKMRRWELTSDSAQVVRYQDEVLRIVPQPLWDSVKARQQAIEHSTLSLRSALKRAGALPRHLLSGLLVCELCGGTIRCVNSREYGCATYKDGGPAACSNGVRVRIDLAERRLLTRLQEEMLSPEGVALLERRVREHARSRDHAPIATAKSKGTAVAKKEAELEQLRSLAKQGTLSPAVAEVAILQAEDELQRLNQARPVAAEKATARILRLLPRAAETMRERIAGGSLGLRDTRSIVQGRNVLFAAFGGKVPVRPAESKVGEKPYLVARMGLNRRVLLDAAVGAAGCLEFGSGGRI